MMFRDFIFTAISGLALAVAGHQVRLVILREDYIERMAMLGGNPICLAREGISTFWGVLAPYPPVFLDHCFAVTSNQVVSEYLLLLFLCAVPFIVRPLVRRLRTIRQGANPPQVGA